MVSLVEMDRNATFFKQLTTQDREPIVLVNRFHVEPADRAEFLRLWQEDAHFMLSQGCLSAQLHEGTEGSASFLNVAVWENAQALAKAFQNPEFQKMTARYPDSCTASPHIFKKIAVPGICVA